MASATRGYLIPLQMQTGLYFSRIRACFSETGASSTASEVDRVADGGAVPHPVEVDRRRRGGRSRGGRPGRGSPPRRNRPASPSPRGHGPGPSSAWGPGRRETARRGTPPSPRPPSGRAPRTTGLTRIVGRDLEARAALPGRLDHVEEGADRRRHLRRGQPGPGVLDHRLAKVLEEPPEAPPLQVLRLDLRRRAAENVRAELHHLQNRQVALPERDSRSSPGKARPSPSPRGPGAANSAPGSHDGPGGRSRGGKRWCPGAELNRRHRTFQARALPAELPGHRARRGMFLADRPSTRRPALYRRPLE